MSVFDFDFDFGTTTPEQVALTGLGTFGWLPGLAAAYVMDRYGVSEWGSEIQGPGEGVGIGYDRDPMGLASLNGPLGPSTPAAGTPDNVDGGGGRPGYMEWDVPWTPIGNSGYGYTRMSWSHDVGEAPANWVPKPTEEKPQQKAPAPVRTAHRGRPSVPSQQIRRPMVVIPQTNTPMEKQAEMEALIKQKQEEELARIEARKGVSSTVNTSPLGVIGPADILTVKLGGR